MTHDCEDQYGRMSADFLEYLRERGTAGRCDHHCGGVCDIAKTILY